MRHLFHNIILISLILFSLFACKEDNNVNGSSQLVIEGWIDNDNFPIVKVTRTVTMGNDFVDISELNKYVERWAKVTINDGEKEVILSGQYNKSSYPPFIYTTTDMRGQLGKTYHLSVDTPEGLHAEATTTIPYPAVIDSFKVEEVAQEDSVMYQIYGYTSYRGACKIFTRDSNHDTEFLSAYLGIYDSTMLSHDGCLSISRGRSGFSHEYTPFFEKGTTVYVKFSTLTDEGYRFWRNFEDMVSLSTNPLFPATANLPSNIQGGLGYWLGYGSTYYRVAIR